jgi:hypothetical protein
MYELIDSIRTRLGLYIGHESPTNLHSFLNGYIYGKELHKKEDFGRGEFGGFDDWVAQKLSYTASTSGWAYMIADQRSDDREGIWLFFELLDEYRNIQNEEIGRVVYNENKHKIDCSWGGYAKFKKIRGTFKAIKKANPTEIIIKKMNFAQNCYSLVAVNDKNEVLFMRYEENVEGCIKNAKRIFGIEEEEWN